MTEMDEELLGLATVVREALACHEALFRLGFSKDDIYLELARSANPDGALLPEDITAESIVLHVVLKTQGKEYSIGVGAVATDGFEDEWAKAIVCWHDASIEGRRKVWEEARLRGRAVELVWGLFEKGIATKNRTAS